MLAFAEASKEWGEASRGSRHPSRASTRLSRHSKTFSPHSRRVQPRRLSGSIQGIQFAFFKTCCCEKRKSTAPQCWIRDRLDLTRQKSSETCVWNTCITINKRCLWEASRAARFDASAVFPGELVFRQTIPFLSEKNKRHLQVALDGCSVRHLGSPLFDACVGKGYVISS